MDISSAIPDEAVIKRAFAIITDPLTAVTIGQAALSLQSAGDLVGATVVSGAPWDASGGIETVVGGDAADMLVLTDDRRVTLDVTVDQLTAGSFRVFVEYIAV